MFKRIFKLSLLSLLTLPLAANANFTYEGTLLDATDHPVTSANVTLRLEVLSLANNCALYAETQNIDTTNTQGYFSVTVGAGSSLAISAYSLNQVFEVASFTGLTCDIGNTYVSTANEPRKLRVSVTVNGGTQELLGSLTINPVPLALSAENSRKVGGFETKYLLRVDPAQVPGGTTNFSSAQFSELLALISGTSTQYITAGSGNAGTITAITAGTGLIGGTITTSGTLSVNVGTSPGQIPVLDGSGKIVPGVIPPISATPTGTSGGDLAGNYPNPSVQGIRGQMIMSPAGMPNQVLAFDGAYWNPRRLGLQDMYSSLNTPQLPSTCGLGQTLNYSAITDSFNCYTIQVTTANLTLSSIALNHLQPSVQDMMWTASAGDLYRNIGRVGIGTAPATALHVSNSNNPSTPTTLMLDSFTSTTPYGAIVNLRGARGSAGSPGAVINGDSLAAIKAYGYDGTAYGVGADIQFITSSAWSGANHNTDIIFRTSNSTSPTEILRLGASGNVGIGTATPTEKLHVNGTVLAAAHTTSSDIRLKSDIKKIQNPLLKILKLSGVEYNWREDIVQPVQHEQRHDIGVIAQQVEEVFPEAVTTSKENGYKAVAYSKLVAPLIEAVKALYYQKADISSVEKLETRLEKSEQENRDLKARIEALEKLIPAK